MPSDIMDTTSAKVSRVSASALLQLLLVPWGTHWWLRRRSSSHLLLRCIPFSSAAGPVTNRLVLP